MQMGAIMKSLIVLACAAALLPAAAYAQEANHEWDYG